MNLEKEVKKKLKEAPTQEVFKYHNGTYVGRYYYKQIILYGQTFIEETFADTKKLSMDICRICLWKGPSVSVEGNKCPVCGSTDLDDYIP